MDTSWRTWPRRFVRWLLASPFQRLPAAFGNPVPGDMQAFEAEADAAQHQGVGRTAQPPASRHAKTHPARQDSALERQ
jgi:hypothetical protein